MSSMCRRHIRQIICLMTFVMMLLVLCSSLSSAYCEDSRLSAFSSPSVSFANKHESLQPTDNPFILTAIPTQPALHEIKPAQRAAGRIQNRPGSLQPVAGTQILPLMSMVLFMHNYAALLGKRSKHISVIALLMGGHAPPSTQVL